MITVRDFCVVDGKVGVILSISGDAKHAWVATYNSSDRTWNVPIWFLCGSVENYSAAEKHPQYAAAMSSMNGPRAQIAKSSST